MSGRELGGGARQLAREGVIGRFALDFIATPRANEAQWSNPTARKRLERSGRWDLYAVEINLRQGGTTHPVNTLKLRRSWASSALASSALMPSTSCTALARAASISSGVMTTPSTSSMSPSTVRAP